MLFGGRVASRASQKSAKVIKSFSFAFWVSRVQSPKSSPSEKFIVIEFIAVTTVFQL